jgi:hypothetical protein
VELDKLVLKLMAKDAIDRYQSAAEMLADLGKIRDSLQVGTTAILPDTFSSMPARAEDARPAVASNGPATKTNITPSVAGTPAVTAAELVLPVWDALARLSPRVLITTSALALLVGGVVGWNARNPEVLSLPSDASVSVPALWLDPRWTTVPKQGNSPEDQFRYALLQASDDEQVPAFLAVAGNFPRSHDVLSKAYVQLARIWYRHGDLQALGALEAELSQWEQAKDRYKDLVDSIRTAILLRKGDLQGMEKGMKSLVRDDIPDMFDAGLVEMNLEVCADAINAATRFGSETMRGTLQGFWQQIVRRLYRIERPGGVRPAGRAVEKKRP